MKQSIYKTLVVVLFIALILETCLIVKLKRELNASSESASTSGNTYDWRHHETFGEISIKATWIGQPLVNVTVEISDINLHTVYSTKTNIKGEAKINLSDLELDDLIYYINMTTIVHFVEGGTEVIYKYVIFKADIASTEVLAIDLECEPQLWENEPDIKVNPGN